MSVYSPTGSGNVHVDRVISGGKKKGKAMAEGMGFKAAAKSVAKKSGVSQQAANAIIAAGARSASPAAKKANPNLKKVTAKKAAPKMAGEMPPQFAKNAAKKAGKKAAPTAMAEQPLSLPQTPRSKSAASAVAKRAGRTTVIKPMTSC